MDTGSTITILNGVRFIPTRFVAYEPTVSEVLVQTVSGQLLSSMGRCIEGRTECIQLWFARQLPADVDVIGLEPPMSMNDCICGIKEAAL